MPVTDTSPLAMYVLPEEGPACRADFLTLLHSPGHTVIRAFNFSMPALFDEIRKADAAGVTGDILIDHTQAGGPSERESVRQLAADLQNWNVTIGTAGCGSKTTGAIEHDKLMIVDDPGNEPVIWTGSTNMSDLAFGEANLAFIMRSAALAGPLLAKFDAHVDWNRQHHPDWQVKPLIDRAKSLRAAVIPSSAIPTPGPPEDCGSSTVQTITDASGDVTEVYRDADGHLETPVVTTHADGTTEVAE